MGVSKKSAAGGDARRWEGSLKKPDVIRSPRNQGQKNKEVPVRLGFLGELGHGGRIVKKEKGKRPLFGSRL